jgi:hypothetical protein
MYQIPIAIFYVGTYLLYLYVCSYYIFYKNNLQFPNGKEVSYFSVHSYIVFLRSRYVFRNGVHSFCYSNKAVQIFLHRTVAENFNRFFVSTMIPPFKSGKAVGYRKALL